MADQETARSLPPPDSLRDLTRKAYQNNQVGDELWNSMINISKRTNQTIDESLGIQNPYNQNRS